MRNLEPPPPPPPVDYYRQLSPNNAGIVVGFLGWYLINWLFLKGSPNTGSYDLSLVFSPIVNIVVLFICAIVKPLRQVALGILIAIAFNLFISLAFGMFFNALCFIPFFIGR